VGLLARNCCWVVKDGRVSLQRDLARIATQKWTPSPGVHSYGYGVNRQIGLVLLSTPLGREYRETHSRLVRNPLELHSGRSMHQTFTLHEDAWLRGGPVFASGQVTGYRVGGMPDGTTAKIANFGAPSQDDWRIMRINSDNTQPGWTGHYRSVEEALAALQQRSQYNG